MSEKTLRRDFDSRAAMLEYLRETFPEAAAFDDHVSETRGGRREGLRRLRVVKMGKEYANTRNSLNGAVTRLSPYIRHGVVTLAEVRDAALSQVRSAYDAEKFISELGWRDYFQRVYADIGDGIWVDREDYKTGLRAEQYADSLPDDIRDGQTGLACIDAASRDLVETGYLHNHQRMWMAAYVVHWRRVKWQAGARWFLHHLLDGDPASNNLSWQWVASTFSSKPYFFNRENVEKFSDGVYCRECPLRGRCDFEGSYERIEAALFPNADSHERQDRRNERDHQRRPRR